MSRRYYRRHRKNDGISGTLLFVGIIAVATLYNKLSAATINLIIGGGLLLVGVIIGLVLFIQFKRSQHEKQKLRALNLIDTDYMDGLAFEKYVAELLKSQGYGKVTLTERYDLGVDIIALKDGIRWGVQVKRYSNMVKAEAVRQVVTALNKYNCQRSMVVTNSTFSRPARVLADSNDCVLIGKDELAEWIIAFQEGN
ncbi:MAG TPA: restriction endonuclease [Candidatus Saccharimonadales bacterium]|nr:restriction endonuclease [Candidatus Saccharimonadales bacterium]